MGWTINYTEAAKKQLQKLDKQTARRIVDYMQERISTRNNPRDTGKALTGILGEFWRYRIGDYRVICEIQNETLCVLVIKVGNRRDVYH